MKNTATIARWILIVFALANGGLLIWNIPTNPAGLATVTVPLHNLLGIAAAAAAMVQWKYWRPMMIVWAAALVPILAGDASGRLTRSIVNLSYANSETMTVSGRVSSHHEIGINLVGVLLLICCWLAKRPHARRQNENDAGEVIAT